MKWLIISLIVLLLIVGAFDLLGGFDSFAIERSRQAGLHFSKICGELNGKPFNLESINKLNGFVDLNGSVRPTQKDLDNYEKKGYLFVYHQSWFQSNGIEHTWYCDIKRVEDSKIKSNAIFHVGD